MSVTYKYLLTLRILLTIIALRLLMHLRTASSLKFVHDLVQAFTLAQNHEHTQIIVFKIFLAGLQVLLRSACIAGLSWACGWVLHHVFGV